LQKSMKLETYISLINFKHQLSEQSIAAAVHSPSVNSPPNTYLIPILFLFTFLLFCTPVSLLAPHHLLIYYSSVNLLNCNYFATMAYLLPYLLTPCAHTVYRLSFFLLCY
jgi:hypothetical protein